MKTVHDGELPVPGTVTEKQPAKRKVVETVPRAQTQTKNRIATPPPEPAALAAARAAAQSKALATVPAQSALASASELISVTKLPRAEQTDPRVILTRTPDSPQAAAFRVLRHRLLEK